MGITKKPRIAKPRKKLKPLSTSKIKKLLHEAVKTVVLKRDRVCRICGNKPANTPYHIIPRSYLAVTWDLRNVVGSCVGCNFAEHNNRLAYRDKHRSIFGESFYDDLWETAKKGRKWARFELIELLESLKLPHGGAENTRAILIEA